MNDVTEPPADTDPSILVPEVGGTGTGSRPPHRSGPDRPGPPEEGLASPLLAPVLDPLRPLGVSRRDRGPPGGGRIASRRPSSGATERTGCRSGSSAGSSAPGPSSSPGEPGRRSTWPWRSGSGWRVRSGCTASGSASTAATSAGTASTCGARSARSPGPPPWPAGFPGPGSTPSPRGRRRATAPCPSCCRATTGACWSRSPSGWSSTWGEPIRFELGIRIFGPSLTLTVFHGDGPLEVLEEMTAPHRSGHGPRLLGLRPLERRRGRSGAGPRGRDPAAGREDPLVGDLDRGLAGGPRRPPRHLRHLPGPVHPGSRAVSRSRGAGGRAPRPRLPVPGLLLPLRARGHRGPPGGARPGGLRPGPGRPPRADVPDRRHLRPDRLHPPGGRSLRPPDLPADRRPGLRRLDDRLRGSTSRSTPASTTARTGGTTTTDTPSTGRP